VNNTRKDSPISVVIPAWNEERSLKETLLALVNMDYDKRQCEIIIVAGGRDKTYDTALSLKPRMHAFERYAVIEQKPDGKNIAIQAGVEFAKNGIIVLVDADTLVCGSCVRIMVSAVEKKQADIAFANPIPIHSTWVANYYMIIKGYALDEISFYSGHAVAFRKEIVKKRLDHFFDPNVRVGVDYLLAKRFLEEGFNALFLKEALVKTHVPWSFPYFVRTERRWLTALVNIDGINVSNLARHAVLVWAAVFALPFFGNASIVAWIINALFLAKRYYMFRVGSNRQYTPKKELIGFVFLSYVYHFIGLFSYVRYCLGLSRQDSLSQGQRV
jgi:cellulose synthase/poly-beta-1,6-N-acetylglucosamine synthase-like glycosyltransferase